MSTEFEQQLKGVERQMVSMSSEYPELSPVEQQECLSRLEDTIKTLTGMCESLSPPVRQACHEDTVQLVGMPDTLPGGARALTKALQHVSGFTIVREDNYKLDEDLKPVPVVEHFVCFRDNADACYALCLQVLQLVTMGGTCFGMPAAATVVNVVKPTRTPTVRAKYRRIGALVARLKEIKQEFQEIGAVRDGGLPRLSLSFVEKSWLVAQNNMPRWKRLRSQGESLDHNAYGALLLKPVARGPIEARIRAVYDEECDALIELRYLQVEGWDFSF